MNDFASSLSSALHEEAQEIAMSADIQQAERRLQKAIRSVDRRRRVWIAVAAAAVIVVAVTGTTLGFRLPTTQPAGSTPTTSQQAPAPVPFAATQLNPPMTVQLPHWTLTASHGEDTGPYASAYDFERPDAGREIHLLSVGWMYPLGTTAITKPSYAELVADWKAVQPFGYGTVSDVSTTSVGGKPATTMTVAVTQSAAGLAFCDSPTTGQNVCAGIDAGRTLHLAIVDQGASQPPTLLWENAATDDSASPSAAAEFATWLATVRFG